MGSYSAPSHPPPPKVPNGWKPVWNDQYSEYFFVNMLTRKSTWDKPTESAKDDNNGTNSSRDRSIHSRNEGNGNQNSSDRGHAEEYYSGAPVSHGPLDQEGVHNGSDQSNRSSSGMGLRDKIRGKMNSNRSGGGGGYYAPPPQPMGYGGGPPMPMGGPVYAPPPQPYGYGYGMSPQPMYMQQPMRRRQGMGPGGGAALGLGGGLLGGMMLGNAMNSGQQDAYQDGFADGADFDGGDMDGGDFGGDFGE